jgi:antitoxin protein of toxin-antitoxin system
VLDWWRPPNDGENHIPAPEAEMTESNFTERATALANQAAEAAGPLIVKAKELAGELAVKAGPYVEKAGPYMEKAAGIAAQGVAVAAGQLDKATGGKYSDKISSVTSKIETTLDKDK